MRPVTPPSVRFWAKVAKTDGCWLWTAGAKDGYGRFRVGGAGSPRVLAHRFAYEEIVGPIPDGLVLDHLCKTPACVRPDHLEPVTNRENLRREVDRRTHCRNGHPFTLDNLVQSTLPTRRCRTCFLAYRRERYHRLKAEESPLAA